MGFQKIVDGICTSLYHQAIHILKRDWDEKNYAAMEREIQRQYRDAGVLVPNFHHLPYMGATYYWQGYNQKRNSIANVVKAKYTLRFHHTIAPYLKNLWEQKVRDANFVVHLERFFKRHPWLLALATLEDEHSLPARYIEFIINSTLRHRTTHPEFQLLYNPQKTTPDCYDIQWPQFDHQKVMQRLHDYPLELIFQKKYGQFSLLPSLSRRWDSIADPSVYRLSRLDVYKLLFNHFGVTPKTIAPDGTFDPYYSRHGQLAAKVMPVELQELEELDTISKEYCQSWLINIEDSDNPYWILLGRHQNQNSLYIPTELTTDGSFGPKLETIIEVTH